MPAVSVYEFAQKIRSYVSINLGHSKWFIHKIIVVYSTRSKATKFGYKVIPLFVGAMATDENGKATHCRINFDDLCIITGGYSTGPTLPYIKVSTTAKEHRAIFDQGVTCLHIECNKKGSYNGNPFLYHHTEQIECTAKLDKLNATVVDKIKERLAKNNTDLMHKMELQFQELIELDDEDDYDDEPKQLDVDDMSYEYSDIEGGYKN